MSQPFFKAPETSAYFAPIRNEESHLSQESKENAYQSSAERLSILHSRLYSEAEKIRKWKTHTEMELKQKNKTIQEANQTIDSLRKSNVDLQLQNEELSLKLQDELNHRQEVISRIQSTREMCNILKDYAENVEDRFQKCEAEKTEIKYLEKEHMHQCEELTEKFKEMQLNVEEKSKDFQNELQKEKNEREKCCEDYARKLDDSTEQINLLEKEVEEKTLSIRNMTEQLTNRGCEITLLKADFASLQEEVSRLQSEITEKEDDLRRAASAHGELESLKTKFIEQEDHMKEVMHKLKEADRAKAKLSENMDETEKLYIEKIKDLNGEIAVKKKEIEAAEDGIRVLESALNGASLKIEDLKSAKDMLILELAEAENKIKALEASHVSLEGKHNELRKLNKEIQLENEDLQKRCKVLQDVESNLVQVKQEMESKEEELMQMREKIIHLEETLKGYAVVSLQIVAKESEMEQLGENLDEANKKLSDSEDRMSKLRADLTAKEKQNKELEKEIKSLKSKVTSNSKSSTKFENLTKELKEKLSSAEEEIQVLQAAVAKFQKEVEEQERVNENLKKEYADSDSKAKQEKEQSDLQYEDRIQILSRGLEKYKEGYEEVINKKDSEIKDLKMLLDEKVIEVEKLKETAVQYEENLKQSDDSHQEVLKLKKDLVDEQKKFEKALSESRKEIESLKNKLSESGAEKDKLKKKVSDLEEETTSLTKHAGKCGESVPTQAGHKKSMQAKATPVAVATVAVCTPQVTSTSRANVYSTPKNSARPKVPVSAQRSILRPVNDLRLNDVSSKRRKVVFNDWDVDMMSQESSESDLMEVEFNRDIKLIGKPSKIHPKQLQLKHSKDAMPKTAACAPALQVTPNPRGSSVLFTPKKGETAESGGKQLYGNLKPESKMARMAQSIEANAAKSPNVRKTPSKNAGKFFKSSQMGKITIRRAAKTQKKDDSLAWFDTDKAFGFGPDD